MEASPTPTIYGRGRPIERGEGTGLAVALTSLRSRLGGLPPPCCIALVVSFASRVPIAYQYQIEAIENSSDEALHQGEEPVGNNHAGLSRMMLHIYLSYPLD